MRNPSRIDPLLAKLGEAWRKCPDLRFGQFIEYFFSEYGKSPFPVEDDVWMVGIQAFIDGEDVADAMNAYTDERYIEAIVRQTAGSMALSGMELTEEDKNRIRKIPHMTKEEIEAEVQILVEKHKQK